MREIVLDTETTGLRPSEGHRVIEIAAIELVDFLPTGRVYQQYINPMRDVPEASFKVHGLSYEFLKDKPLFEKIADDFLDFVGQDTIIAHNVDFDIGFLNHELKLIGKNKIENKVVDTLILARDKFPGSSISLDSLCKRYRVDNSKRAQHSALVDCDLLAKVYINLIDQKEPTLDFQNQDEKLNILKKGKVSYFKKVVQISEEEMKKHKEFLKINLKKNYFN